jgi:hypothetical protein
LRSRGESESRQKSRIDRLFDQGWPIDQAIRKGVVEALREHLRAGRSIVVWRDGRVVELAGEAIDRELERALAADAERRAADRA